MYKVGDYVRTIYGTFAKIIERVFDEEKEIIVFSENIIPYYERMVDNCYKEELDKYIIKSSPKIKDLIQDGDYVNGCKVVIINNIKHLETRKGLVFLRILEQIKSIVTKEQFEALEYEVKQ